MTWFNTSYLFKKQITIDHTKVSGGANLSNFPVLISMTDVNLKVVGSGGSVQNSSGFDIIFTDSTETTQLDHEIEKYVSTTGEIEMWVRIPTLSFSADTIIYCYYDNAAISTSQENKTGVWDSNYQLVYHLKEDPSGTAPQMKDSTVNAGHGTASNLLSGAQVAGQIDGSLVAAGSTGLVTSGYSGLPTVIAVEAWINVTGTGGSALGRIFDKKVAGTQTLYWAVNNVVTTLRLEAAAATTNGDWDITISSGWHLVAFVWDRSSNANVPTFYVDGAAVSTTTATQPVGTLAAGTDAYVLLNRGDGTRGFTGGLDEFRISSASRTAGWLATSYANQKTPSTFFSVGAALVNGVALSLVGTGVGTLVGTLTLALTALSLYGSNVAAGGVTTAGKCATTTGGVEVAAVTTAPASGSGYVECFALGGTSTVNAALPAPSGKGWILDSTLLEGQRLIAGNWGASVAVSDANGGGPVVSYTLRFWQRSSGGAYAIIGSLVLSASQVISTLRVVKTFLAAAMPQTDFVVGDKLYIDFFINANGWASDVLSVYVSSSGSAGVAGDLEVDTAGYTPSGTAGVVTSYIPRALSAILVVTSTALLDTLSGSGTLTGAISSLSTALSLTFSSVGTLSGQVTANLALPATTLVGVGNLASTPSLATSLAASQFAGSSILAASILARTVLISTLTGSSTLASSFQLATNLTGMLAGTSQLSATITASLALPGIALTGGGTLSGTISASTLTPVALAATLAGGGTYAGTLMLATQLTGTYAGVSTLSATITASTTLVSTTFPGSGALIGATARGTALSTTTLVGVGTLGASLSATLTLSGANLAGVGILNGTLTGAGGLAGILSGGGILTGSLSAALQLSGTSLAGVGALSAAVQANTVLGTTLSGGSTLSGVPSARTVLGATLVGASTLAGTTTLTTALAGTLPGAGTLTGAAGRSTTLSVALPGSGQLAAVGSAQTALTSSFAGVSAAAFTVFLRTSLSVTLSGAGNVTSASLSYRAALALTLSGLASLSGSLTVPVLAYLSATWVTRDGQAVWVTRDEQEATWVTRDGQATWKIRS